jgi:hypothetical protein
MFGYLPIYVTNQRVSRICGPLELRSAIKMVTVFLLLWIDVFAQQRSISQCYSHCVVSVKIWETVVSLRWNCSNESMGVSVTGVLIVPEECRHGAVL